MSIRCIGRHVYGVMLVLTLLVGCRKAESTPSPDLPTNTSVPPVAEPDDTEGAWFKTYGGDQGNEAYDILLAEDSGYFIVGATNIEYEPERQGDIYLIKTDATGQVLWEKTYGREGYQIGLTIFQTSDGGVLISGPTASSETGGMDLYLLKVDQDGNELWFKTFGGPLDEFGTVWPTEDGGYLLAGSLVDPNDVVADPGAAGYGGFAGRSSIYIAKTDADGNELWSHTFGGENNVMTKGGIQTPEGEFLILATIMDYPENDDDIHMLKVDANGNEVWSQTWEDDRLSGRALIQTPDGNYLLTGIHSPLDAVDRSAIDFLFIKVDPAGNEIWKSTCGEPDVRDYGSLLAETEDGGYIAVGNRVRSHARPRNEELVFVEVDASGEFLRERVIETNTHVMLGAILRLPEGGYAVVGSIARNDTFDIILIKTDTEGNVPDWSG